MSRQVNSGDPSSGFPSKREFDQKGQIADADLSIVGAIDPTKKIEFSAAGQTTGKTVTVAAGANTGNITLTLPASSGTLARTADVTSYTPPTSTVRVSNITGFGSSATLIPIYGNTIVNTGGVDIVYASDATNGSKFTIGTTGMYGISTTGVSGAAGNALAITINSDNLTTAPNNLSAEKLPAFASGIASNYAFHCSCVVYLTAGDIVRTQFGAAYQLNIALENFTICRLT